MHEPWRPSSFVKLSHSLISYQIVNLGLSRKRESLERWIGAFAEPLGYIGEGRTRSPNTTGLVSEADWIAHKKHTRFEGGEKLGH